MPSASAPSYDRIPDFGLLYDSVPLYLARPDLPFYLAEATRGQETVLELGCGTGRVLLPIARAGRTIAGVDSSREMLARCDARVRAEPKEVRDRVTLHAADIRTFDLGARYDLIIAPFRVAQHLTTIEDQLLMLDAVARHLAPGGRFIFDVFNPSFGALVGMTGMEREDTPEQPLPDGRTFRRAARIVRVRWIDQVSEVELIYYVSDASGAAAHRHVQSFDMRWYLQAELRHLLARGGFGVEAVYGDFARAPLRDESPEQVVCARRLAESTTS